VVLSLDSDKGATSISIQQKETRQTMATQFADIVFVVDASQSMGPCFDQLRKNLETLMTTMRQARFRPRLGLLTHAAGIGPNGPVYDHQFIGGEGQEMLSSLYQRGGQNARSDDFFTEDPRRFTKALSTVKPQGNEDMLLALDIALDFPFGPLAKSRRAVALFTDEPAEEGIDEGESSRKIEALINKIQTRHIQLFLVTPESKGYEILSEADKCEWEEVDGGDGLAGFDFKQLLADMGKSISVATLQSSREKDWPRALFGQDRWSADRSADDTSRHLVLNTGESTTLSTSNGPITNVAVKLKWTKAVDLDLHAFYMTRDGKEHHVSFMNKDAGHGIRLDQDSGVGDTAGANEENLTVSTLEGIDRILFATNIYGGKKSNDRFANYDGKIQFTTNHGQVIDVPLQAQQKGNWCVLSILDNSGQNSSVVTSINAVIDHDPSLHNY